MVPQKHTDNSCQHELPTGSGLQLQHPVLWDAPPHAADCLCTCRLWFFAYFAVSFILINVYSLYAGVLTQDDKTSSVFPQWSIMVMQSLLLFMFW